MIYEIILLLISILTSFGPCWSYYFFLDYCPEYIALAHCCSNYAFLWLLGRIFFSFELSQYLEKFLTCIMHSLYLVRLIVTLEFSCLFIFSKSFLRFYLAEIFTFPNGGPLLVGTCEYSKFTPSIYFNNWLIQGLYFIKLSSASTFFACFVNSKKATDYPWSCHSSLSIVLEHKSFLSVQDEEEGAITLVIS